MTTTWFFSMKRNLVNTKCPMKKKHLWVVFSRDIQYGGCEEKAGSEYVQQCDMKPKQAAFMPRSLTTILTS